MITLTQAAIQILEELDWDPLTIFYEADQDIRLWSDYISRERSFGSPVPKLIQLPQYVETFG